MIIFLALIAAPLVLAKAFGRDDHWRPLRAYSIVTGLLGFALLVLFVTAPAGTWNGLVQRIFVSVLFLWIAVLALRLARIHTSLLGQNERLCRESRRSSVLAFTGHPHEMTGARIAESCEYCTWSLPSPGLLGPGDIQLARPFSAEPDLFAAPLAQLRDGSWVIVGFRNLEPKASMRWRSSTPSP